MQNGVTVNDVTLPPWAKGSAEEFIRIQRMALESEYVSLHLHHWIDLIFGYKQRGTNAVEAKNVFYYLTYEGAVDLKKITDPVLRKATEAQIASFGQCPAQLLSKPHPARSPRPIQSHLMAFTAEDVLLSSRTNLAAHSTGGTLQEQLVCSFRVVHSVILKVSFETEWIPTQVMLQDDKFIAWTSDGQFKAFRWNTSPNPPLVCTVTPGQASGNSLGTYTQNPHSCRDRFVAILSQKLLFSTGHWDNSLRVSYLYSTWSALYRVRSHKKRVTCVVLDSATMTLVSGSADCTLMVWKLAEEKASGDMGQIRLEALQAPHLILRGHDAEITCLAVSSNFDIVVSGARCGTVLLHTLRQGKYVRALEQPTTHATSADMVLISNTSQIVVFSCLSRSLLLYDINGRLLIEAPAAEHTNDMIVNADASFLLCGGSGITIRLLHNLQIVFKMDVGSEVTSLALTHDDRILFVGLKSGHMLLCATCFTNSLSMTPPLQSPRVSSVTSSPSTTPRT